MSDLSSTGQDRVQKLILKRGICSVRKFICITLVSLHLRIAIWDGLTQFELSAVEKAGCSLFNSKDVFQQIIPYFNI